MDIRKRKNDSVEPMQRAIMKETERKENDSENDSNSESIQSEEKNNMGL